MLKRECASYALIKLRTEECLNANMNSATNALKIGRNMIVNALHSKNLFD